MASIALESTERLTRLINDILDLERIESGTRPMELAAIDAVDLLRASATEMEGLAHDSGVRLEIGEAPGRVLADRDRIVQTLTNLLGNAIKFSSEGGAVRLDATEHDSEVVFTVSDEGRGIPEDKLEAIFERFEQVDSSDARQKGGTGLGLAISRGIVERHGGRIWAESELGVGTTVLFSLPRSRRGQADLGDEASDAPLLLVCDDDPATVDLFSAMLRRHGYRTLGVTDGSEAVQRAVTEQPAALLLDLRDARHHRRPGPGRAQVHRADPADPGDRRLRPEPGVRAAADPGHPRLADQAGDARNGSSRPWPPRSPAASRTAPCCSSRTTRTSPA